MHKLLARQLQRYQGSAAAPPEGWTGFVAAVGSAYDQADADRALLERSLDLASQELTERFRQLQDDVVERQHSARELERSLSLLRATLDSTTDGIVVVDHEGHIVDCNRRFVDMWRIPERVIALRDAELYLEWVREQVQDPSSFIGRVREMSLQPEGESDDVLDLVDGRIFERHSQPQWIAAESVGRVWSFRDVTAERRRAEEALRQSEEQLRQAQKMEAIGQLAGGVAHDFNNLLTAISGFSDLVLARMDRDDPLRSYIEEIAKAGNRAAALTGQLLAFSRRQVLQPKVLDLNSVVADMGNLLRRLIGEDIQLTLLLAPDLGQVRADPGQLSQVILNLAANARDAMPTGGKLTIETANVELDETMTSNHMLVSPGPYVMVAISDTGTGMDAQTRAHIFEPFFTTKGPGKGTGLGLATVYGIVKQSEGDVAVYSEPGHGTTFRIYLPRCGVVVPELAPAPEVTACPPGSETLLLVEDEPGVRLLAGEVLTGAGYTVLIADGPAEALKLSVNHAEPIDLLVTDVVMPWMSGRELAQQLLLQRPQMRVLYMSGYTPDVAVRHGVLEATMAYLSKPFSPLALGQKVREVLDADTLAVVPGH